MPSFATNSRQQQHSAVTRRFIPAFLNFKIHFHNLIENSIYQMGLLRLRHGPVPMISKHALVLSLRIYDAFGRIVAYSQKHPKASISTLLSILAYGASAFSAQQSLGAHGEDAPQVPNFAHEIRG
jgi:hypothetical protein